MLLNKNHAHLKWTWNLTAKEKNKVIHGGTSDFWIHVKNPKFKNQAIRVLWGKTLFLTWTNSEWPKLVSETIFFINRDIFVLKSGLRLFWAQEVPKPNQNENLRPLFLKILQMAWFWNFGSLKYSVMSVQKSEVPPWIILFFLTWLPGPCESDIPSLADEITFDRKIWQKI